MCEDEELPTGIDELLVEVGLRESYVDQELPVGIAGPPAEVNPLNFDQKLSDGNEVIFEEEYERMLLSSRVVRERSDEIAMGCSPIVRSINHLCELEISLVELSSISKNPSDESSFCSLAKIMRDTVAARRPVGQSINIAMRKGMIKNNALPMELSRNSNDFRGAISMNDPKTSRPATIRIVSGQCRTECVLDTQDNRLKSISSLAALPVALGEAAPVALGEATPVALGDPAVAAPVLVALGDAILLECPDKKTYCELRWSSPL